MNDEIASNIDYLINDGDYGDLVEYLDKISPELTPSKETRERLFNCLSNTLPWEHGKHSEESLIILSDKVGDYLEKSASSRDLVDTLQYVDKVKTLEHCKENYSQASQYIQNELIEDVTWISSVRYLPIGDAEVSGLYENAVKFLKGDMSPQDVIKKHDEVGLSFNLNNSRNNYKMASSEERKQIKDSISDVLKADSKSMGLVGSMKMKGEINDFLKGEGSAKDLVQKAESFRSKKSQGKDLKQAASLKI